MNSVLRPPRLVPLDEHRAVRIYLRNLPHWRQDGCTYFVTFRLGDSIPDHVRQQWEEEQRRWLAARGIEYDSPRGQWRKAMEKLSKDEQKRFEKHFNRQVQAFLDRGFGACWLRRDDCLDVVRTKLLEGDGKEYHMGDFVIMPNHVHLLITPLVASERNEFRSTAHVERNSFRSGELEIILKKIKGSSAVECNRLIGRSGTFWQAGSYDHIVRSLEQLQAFREYIAMNPAGANITVLQAALYRAVWMDAWGTE